MLQSDSAMHWAKAVSMHASMDADQRTGGCLIRSAAMRNRTGSPGCNLCGSVNPISASHAVDHDPRSSPGNHRP